MEASHFADRVAAGRALGDRLRYLAGTRPVVLGLPRGGVVVAARVAERLGAPLGVVVTRKVRCPGAPELAMGAVAVWAHLVAEVRISHVISRAGVREAEFAAARDAELEVARARAAAWSTDDIDLTDRTVVVVDDGLATGATMRAALQVLRRAGAADLVSAVPVGAPPELDALDELGAEVVYLLAPARFGSVSRFYQDFREVEDATVLAELEQSRRPS